MVDATRSLVMIALMRTNMGGLAALIGKLKACPGAMA